MTEDSQLIGELERAGSRETVGNCRETQGKTHSKKEVQDTRLYREVLANVTENLVGRTTKINLSKTTELE